MSKIIYQHSNGHQTVVTFDPLLFTLNDEYANAATKEVWKALENETLIISFNKYKKILDD